MSAPAGPPLADQPDPNGTYRAVLTPFGQQRLDWIPDIEGAEPAEPVRDQHHDAGTWQIGAGLYASWQPAPDLEPDDD